MRDSFFYALCAVLLGFAGLTVLARNLFRAALALLGVLLCTAVLFLLLQAELVALAQVMVYIGGVMIFVLYAVLLTSELGGKMPSPTPLKAAVGVAVAAVMLAFMADLALRVGHGEPIGGTREAEAMDGDPAALAMDKLLESIRRPVVKPVGDGTNIASLKSLGARLLDPQGFLVPFELISVLLLAAMVGAIAVARHGGAVSQTAGGGGAARGKGQGGSA
ncbi:MAG: NADH-quinone oxidoreductase subunit J [Fibrobacteria bacterium]